MSRGACHRCLKRAEKSTRVSHRVLYASLGAFLLVMAIGFHLFAMVRTYEERMTVLQYQLQTVKQDVVELDVGQEDLKEKARNSLVDLQAPALIMEKNEATVVGVNVISEVAE